MHDGGHPPSQPDNTPIAPLAVWRAAALFALRVTIPICAFAGLWAWLQGYHYPEGLAARLLFIGGFAFIVVTLATVWDLRRR